MRIFITGATGFLGYYLACICVKKGHQVACLKRKTSQSLFDSETEEKIKWINTGESYWKEDLHLFDPEILIHAAWGGVSADERNNAAIQLANVEMTQEILQLAHYRQVIILGSQDEYGRINSCVDENHPLRPLSEYAKAKIHCCQILQEFGCKTGAEWQWIRIFSIYGEKQKPCWLIPSIITKCLNGEKEIQTTAGEQLYSYLYSTDFAQAIESVVGTTGKSGIYNLSSASAIALKDLFSLIRKLTGANIDFQPSLPYRENQSMTILGNSNKFIHTFGPFEHTSLEKGLEKIISKMRCSEKEL
ncbi:MAG: NAD(P)-dependent oxidoreductase [Bacteroidaceae bacterium]|nr:NAD(P)-dependent oxidoreductase [Bacteroidaceae bacterium]